MFGVNVAENVMMGQCSFTFEGILLLGEALDRLRWADFFQRAWVEKYSEELRALDKHTNSTYNRGRVESPQQLADFVENCTHMLPDFRTYFADGRK